MAFYNFRVFLCQKPSAEEISWRSGALANVSWILPLTFKIAYCMVFNIIAPSPPPPPPPHTHTSKDTIPPVQTIPRVAGKSRPRLGDPPPIVLSERSRRDLPSPPQKLMGLGAKFGGESDLGFVIDSAQLSSSNVRMREMWWHRTTAGRACRYSVAYGDRSSVSIPILRRLPPRKGGNRYLCGRSVVKKIRSLLTAPAMRGNCLNAGIMINELTITDVG